ncbi:MAG: aminotransferase class III-fold pyridoxal phosphate-dependent enzyme [Myxococcota bacterium]
MDVISAISNLRNTAGPRRTEGLDDATITRFAALDAALPAAIAQATEAKERVDDATRAAIAGPEAELVRDLQDDFVNFYSAATVNPYIPLAAKGPWIVTTHGAVIHDNGGYGMLGAGHAPEHVLKAMNAPHVMANVMTPSLSHKRFTEAMKREVGQRRGGSPFGRFMCINSGSDAMMVASRIADHHTLRQIGPGGPKQGWSTKMLSLRGSFHGRTRRPAMASHSSLPTYEAQLASFRDRHVWVCPPNDVATLHRLFDTAEDQRTFLELVMIEPVMGEGNPGMAVTREFYDAVRERTLAHGSMLVVDSVQAGLRTTGYLSFVDYPGFEDAVPPDMEAWSKALNAGQYPLSVLGLTDRAADEYVRGVYGNTMTTNPRALDVAVAVLEGLTPELRQNIQDRGAQFVEGLLKLQQRFPGIVQTVQGTGLLCSAEMDPERMPVVGFDGLEMWCRTHGLGLIHGGKNAVRLTPWFGITAAEVDLVIEKLGEGIETLLAQEGPRVVRAAL